MVAVFWLEWMTGELLAIFPKRSPEFLKVCESFTMNNLGLSEGLALSGNKVTFYPRAVGVSMMIHRQISKIRGILTMQMEYWRWIFGVRQDYIIGCTRFSLFARIFARVLLFLARVSLCTFIIVTWFYLTIFIFGIFVITFPVHDDSSSNIQN